MLSQVKHKSQFFFTVKLGDVTLYQQQRLMISPSGKWLFFDWVQLININPEQLLGFMDLITSMWFTAPAKG